MAGRRRLEAVRAVETVGEGGRRWAKVGEGLGGRRTAVEHVAGEELRGRHVDERGGEGEVGGELEAQAKRGGPGQKGRHSLALLPLGSCTVEGPSLECVEQPGSRALHPRRLE